MFDIRRSFTALLLLAGATILPGNARAGQSYDSCAGFIDSLPTTIATQGVWCLRHDLSTAVTSGNAITIAANNVTIDCNDFKIGGLGAGNGSQTNGIYGFNRQNASVRHCNVRGFFRGIYLEGASGAGHLVEDNRLDQNLAYGIRVDGDNNRVRRNAIYDTGGSAFPVSYGIFASADIIGNTVAGVFVTNANSYATGIGVGGYGSVVQDNQVRQLTGSAGGDNKGINVFGSDVTIADNRIMSGGQGSRGVYGSLGSFCKDNTANGFSIAYDSCPFSSGNLPL